MIIIVLLIYSSHSPQGRTLIHKTSSTHRVLANCSRKIYTWHCNDNEIRTIITVIIMITMLIQLQYLYLTSLLVPVVRTLLSCLAVAYPVDVAILIKLVTAILISLVVATRDLTNWKPTETSVN